MLGQKAQNQKEAQKQSLNFWSVIMLKKKQTPNLFFVALKGKLGPETLQRDTLFST